MIRPVGDVVAIERVQFPAWPSDWYVRITAADGHVWHTGPWRSMWAADRCAQLCWERYEREGRVNVNARRAAPAR